MPAAIYDPKEAEAVEPSIKPTGVNVTAVFGAIRVSGTSRSMRGMARRLRPARPCERLRHPVVCRQARHEDDARRRGNLHDGQHQAAAGYGYYVWVRHINKAGIEGPVHTDGGAFVLVRLTPEMSNLLDKQIKFDFLDTDVADTPEKAGEDAKKAFDSLTTIDKKASESLALSQTTAELACAC